MKSGRKLVANLLLMNYSDFEFVARFFYILIEVGKESKNTEQTKKFYKCGKEQIDYLIMSISALFLFTLSFQSKHTTYILTVYS